MTKDKRECEVCGNQLPPGRSRFCSDECRKSHYAKMEKTRTGKLPRKAPFRLLTCPICGAEEMRHIKSKLCSACQIEQDKKTTREYKERSMAGKARHLGEKYPCEECGEMYILSSGKQRYCPICAPKVVAEHIRNSALQRYEDAKASDPDFLEKRNARRPKRDDEWKTCVVCEKKYLAGRGMTLYCSEDCQSKGLYAQSHKDYENGCKSIDKIKAVRKEFGLTQKQFSEALNIPIGTLRKWEQGKRDCPQYVVELIEYRVNHDQTFKKEK